MKPPIKDQTDIGVDNPMTDASDGAIIRYHDKDDVINKDVARQEFAEDADLHHMLNKFGVVPERGAPTYGEWDDNLDLQQALTSVAEARAAFKDLPPELKEKFNNMDELIKAYENGNLVIRSGDAPAPVKTEAELLQERITELEKRIPPQQE